MYVHIDKNMAVNVHCVLVRVHVHGKMCVYVRVDATESDGLHVARSCITMHAHDQRTESRSRMYMLPDWHHSTPGKRMIGICSSFMDEMEGRVKAVSTFKNPEAI